MRLFKGFVVALALMAGVGAAYAAMAPAEPAPQAGSTTDGGWCPPYC